MLADVKKPEKDEWGTGLEAMQSALQLEKNVNTALLELHSIAVKHNDPQVQLFGVRSYSFCRILELSSSFCMEFDG